MRIISAAPSNTEILFELGLKENIVATTSLCDHPKEALNLPSIGGWSQGVDYEKIEELDPDVVVLSDSLQDSQREKLDAMEIDTVQVSPESLEEVYRSIAELGKIFGREEEAEKLVQKMKSAIDDLDLEGRKIYCEEWSDPPMVSANWIPDLIEAAGGRYFVEGGRSREFETDELRKFDPEFVFLNICGAGENADPEKVLEREKWKGMTAVRNGDVHAIDDALLNRPGPRLVEALREIESVISRS